MTLLALLPIAATFFAFGVGLTWPIAHRAGRTSATRAAERDRHEIGRILGGLEAPTVIEPEPPAPAQHAAPTVEPNWHRGEHRIYSIGWFAEVFARLLSIGYKPAAPPLAGREYTPRHGDGWRVDTRELAVVVAEETRRRDDEFEALLYSLVAKGAVLR